MVDVDALHALGVDIVEHKYWQHALKRTKQESVVLKVVNFTVDMIQKIANHNDAAEFLDADKIQLSFRELESFETNAIDSFLSTIDDKWKRNFTCSLYRKEQRWKTGCLKICNGNHF